MLELYEKLPSGYITARANDFFADQPFISGQLRANIERELVEGMIDPKLAAAMAAERRRVRAEKKARQLGNRVGKLLRRSQDDEPQPDMTAMVIHSGRRLTGDIPRGDKLPLLRTTVMQWNLEGYVTVGSDEYPLDPTKTATSVALEYPSEDGSHTDVNVVHRILPYADEITTDVQIHEGKLWNDALHKPFAKESVHPSLIMSRAITALIKVGA